MPQVILKKWGNSPSLRLPVSIMEAAKLKVDDTVELAVENGRIIVVPVRDDEQLLHHLLSGITADNQHGEISFGLPVGNEAL